MEIWAHSMIKNEGRWLWYSVGSVINHVDKILLWDTGSTDSSLQIEKKLAKKYPDKIILKTLDQNSSGEFSEARERQEMLDQTSADWFLVLDGDEIWWEDSVKKVIDLIRTKGDKFESVVVPTINLVGDIFHFQGSSAGRYKFGEKVGHYNLRAVKRSIPGLHSQGEHGVWGWADGDGKMIQDRNTYKFIDAPYLHATNLKRSSAYSEVVKRVKKYRFELGEEFPKDFYYPEVFFRDRPTIVPSPWQVMPGSFRFRAFFETPLRKIKRRVWKGRAGY